MVSKEDSVYFHHIFDAISRIEEYLKDIDEIDFKKNHLVQDGVIRQIEIIGEATRKVSSSFRESHPEIPWRDIAGMRDKLIHHYFGVDLDAVWLTATEDIPKFKLEVEKILKDMGEVV